MNTTYTLGQTVDLVCPSDPPVLVRSRIVGLTLDHAGTVWYNVKSVRKPEQGTLCDVPEAGIRPIDATASPSAPGVFLAALCELIMCSDPWPASAAAETAVKAEADRLAREQGFADWVEACHASKPAGHAFKVGDVVSGVPGSALFGRGQLIVRCTDRPGVWPLEVATTRTDRIPASPDELVPVPMDTRADGHNPDGLTVGQVGPGYRLAPEGYVGQREFWHKLRRAWKTSAAPECPSNPGRTYRIVW